jgi:membrane fusion protein (multidrug efflux system)
MPAGRGILASVSPRLITVCFLAAAFIPAACADTVPGLILPLHDVEVGTAVAGLVSEVLAKEGDTVAKDQPLVRLEDAAEKLEVDRAAKVLEKTKFDHEAAEKLLADKIATREAALTKRIEHDLAAIALQTAEVRLRQRTITAPLPGIVVKVDKEPGEAVLLNETVVQVVHIDEVYAQFYLEPAQVAPLKPGAAVPFRVPSLPAPNNFTGSVDFIDPRMDAESGLYRIKLRLPNPGLRLKAGMRAEADFPAS